MDQNFEPLLHLGAMTVLLAVAYLGLDRLSPTQHEKMREEITEACAAAFKEELTKALGKDQASAYEKGYTDKAGKELFLPEDIETRSHVRLIRFARYRLLGLGTELTAVKPNKWLSGKSHKLHAWFVKYCERLIRYCVVYRRSFVLLYFIGLRRADRKTVKVLGSLAVASFLVVVAAALWPLDQSSMLLYRSTVPLRVCDLTIDIRLILFVFYVATMIIVFYSTAGPSLTYS